MTAPEHVPTYGIELAIQGIQGAVADLRGQRIPPVHPHVRATQAIYWICSFDEHHRKVPDYKNQRDSNAAGVIITGLRFARNAVTHGVVPLATVTGETYKLPGFETILTIGQWTWRTRQAITADWPKMNTALNSDLMLSVYDESIAGRQVEDPILAAYGWVKQWSKSRYGMDLL